MWTIIDIGSNSIRAMDISDEGVFGRKRLITTRLAHLLDKNGYLAEENIRHSLEAIRHFAGEGFRRGSNVCAYATSAVRDASNRELFLERMEESCGFRAELLSGEQEARYALLGAGSEGLIDIGGGSSQIVAMDFAQSQPIGCVRAAELVERAAIEDRCRSLFRFPRLRIQSWAGVGGTLTTLGAIKQGLEAYEPGLVSGIELSTDDIESLISVLEEMGEKRASHPLLRARHDVIIPGATIALFIMKGMGIGSLRISDADGMEGYYLAKCAGKN